MRSASPVLRVRAEGRSRALYFATHVMLFVASLWLLGNSAGAQVNGQGTMSGTVTDTSGAIVVGAHVVVTNTATNVSSNTDTNSTGYFEVDHLNPGVYNITASSSVTWSRIAATSCNAVREKAPITFGLHRSKISRKEDR